jgi:pimeloyl-ACP methyl ester carboxylesterase
MTTQHEVKELSRRPITDAARERPLTGRQMGRRPPEVLMIYAPSDPVGSVEIWRRFTQTLPRASLRVVDGARHMPWFHDPAGVPAAVGRFLRSGETGAERH